ncbi:MAG TPA: aminoacyl-tRNA hydrolase [Anaerolineales bacterium]
MNDPGYILVGLGNPGRQYARTRHNVGFLLIDRISVRLDARGMRLQSNALVTTAQFKSRKVLLAKPQTYMNLSGRAVHALARFYKIPLEHLLVAHDDLDLPLGTIRLRPGGGPGGQKGVASTIENLGSKDFSRLRIGIDRPPGRMDPAAYVLQEFSGDDLDVISAVLDRAADAALSFVDEGIAVAMNRFNGSAIEKPSR